MDWKDGIWHRPLAQRVSEDWVPEPLWRASPTRGPNQSGKTSKTCPGASRPLGQWMEGVLLWMGQLARVPPFWPGRLRTLGCSAWCGVFLGLMGVLGGWGQPAFPGAVGAGAEARGGRGGDVYYVTSLGDYVSSTDPRRFGTLRYGIASATGPRTIVFSVSGTITLSNDLRINKSYLTVAGQTAPGDGITLRRRSLIITDARDVIVRYLRVRPGDMDATFQGDGVSVVRSTNVVLDHVSVSWSVDECLSVTHSTRVTVQHCWITESLRLSQHDKGAHGYGSLLRYGDGFLTFFGNLYAHHDNRNPRLGDRLRLEFVNNLLYNWGSRAGYSGDEATDLADNSGGFTNWLAYVGNALVAGPSTRTPSTAFHGGTTNTYLFQLNNWIDANRNGRFDGANTGWSMFGGRYTRLNQWPWPLTVAPADPWVAAFRVLAMGGASKVRDAVDLRILGTVRAQGGRLVDAVGEATQPQDYEVRNVNGTDLVFVRGWPTLASTAAPVDTDLDGMPDFWELAMGLNERDPADRNHLGPTGYTRLEEYLHWRAVPHAICPRNGSIELDLGAFMPGWQGLQYAVQPGTNGTVQRMGDRAVFAANVGATGLASFTFVATDPATGWQLGPETVLVLISATNAPNRPPVWDPVPALEVAAGQWWEFRLSATDPDVPPQRLQFGLLSPLPGLTLDAATGWLRWRVPVGMGGTTQSVVVVVTDDGQPALSATQTLAVVVRPVTPPQLHLTWGTDQRLMLTVTGSTGPEFGLEQSEDLQVWREVMWTNPATLPWRWELGPAGDSRQRFYRIRLRP